MTLARQGDQGQDHCDPVNDTSCAAMIAHALASGAYGVVGGSNYRYTLRFDDLHSTGVPRDHSVTRMPP